MLRGTLALLATLELLGCSSLPPGTSGKRPPANAPARLDAQINLAQPPPNLDSEAPPSPVAPTGLPGVSVEMMTPEFWLESQPDPDAVILTAAQIREYQVDLQAGSFGSLVDMARYPATLDKEKLMALLSDWTPAFETLFWDGQPVSKAQWDAVAANLNRESLQESNAVQLAVTVRPTPLRLWPVSQSWFSQPDDQLFDVLQGSVVDPGEPVAVLHSSLDGAWRFIRAAHSDGWVTACDLAVATPEQWFQYAAPAQFLVVTSSRLDTPEFPSCRMGARIPLWPAPWPERIGVRTTAGTWLVALPTRTDQGLLSIVAATIPMAAPVHSGFLPYTQRNLVELAFRFLGEPYSWGGFGGGEDCSYLLAMIYRCFGFTLPRNSWYQEQLPALDRLFDGMKSWTEVAGVLEDLPAGASLHLKGHVMMYLGELDGRHYVLHALAAYGEGAGAAAGGAVFAPDAPELATLEKPKRVDVMRVVVSDVDLIRTNGASLLLSLTRAKVYTKP